jgi:hypothetical protein
MTMLMHERSPFDRAPDSSRERAGPVTAATRLATIRQAGKFVFAVLLVAAALAGMIALEAAFFLSRLSY